jgi:hypothetical protein
VPSVPDSALPHATLSAFTDERGRKARVNVYLVVPDGASLGALAVLPSAAPAFSGEMSGTGVLSQELDRLPD